MQTPRFCGQPSMWSDLDLLTFGCRGLRISCWIVGIRALSSYRFFVSAPSRRRLSSHANPRKSLNVCPPAIVQTKSTNTASGPHLACAVVSRGSGIKSRIMSALIRQFGLERISLLSGRNLGLRPVLVNRGAESNYAGVNYGRFSSFMA